MRAKRPLTLCGNRAQHVLNTLGPAVHQHHGIIHQPQLLSPAGGREAAVFRTPKGRAAPGIVAGPWGVARGIAGGLRVVTRAAIGALIRAIAGGVAAVFALLHPLTARGIGWRPPCGGGPSGATHLP